MEIWLKFTILSPPSPQTVNPKTGSPPPNPQAQLSLEALRLAQPGHVTQPALDPQPESELEELQSQLAEPHTRDNQEAGPTEAPPSSGKPHCGKLI